jgi:hypothetical protein
MAKTKLRLALEKANKEVKRLELKEFRDFETQVASTLSSVMNVVNEIDNSSVNNVKGYTKVMLALKRNKQELEKLRSTEFQNFDQKANQVMNMLSALLKTMMEMASINAGSRTGL